MLDAREGRGCSHCEDGVPMAYFSFGRGIVRLCIGCLMEWFPGKTAGWLEERLDYYMDHLDYKLAMAQWKEYPQGDKPVKSKFAVKVPPLKSRS